MLDGKLTFLDKPVTSRLLFVFENLVLASFSAVCFHQLGREQSSAQNGSKKGELFSGVGRDYNNLG